MCSLFKMFLKVFKANNVIYKQVHLVCSAQNRFPNNIIHSCSYNNNNNSAYLANKVFSHVRNKFLLFVY